VSALDLETLYFEKEYLESGRIMNEVKKRPKCGEEMRKEKV
jgi:hypothetical protein